MKGTFKDGLTATDLKAMGIKLSPTQFDSSLHFDMIGEETCTLKDTVLDGLYYASAESWTDYAAQSYAFSKAVLSGLGDQTITGYERKGDVITTTYENGTVVETDLAKQIVTVDGTAYAMADYVEEGSWNEA